MTEEHIYYQDKEGILVTDKKLAIRNVTYSFETIRDVRLKKKVIVLILGSIGKVTVLFAGAYVLLSLPWPDARDELFLPILLILLGIGGIQLKPFSLVVRDTNGNEKSFSFKELTQAEAIVGLMKAIMSEKINGRQNITPAIAVTP